MPSASMILEPKNQRLNLDFGERIRDDVLMGIHSSAFA